MMEWILQVIGPRITRKFKSFCSNSGLDVITVETDRHGSLEWLAGQQDSLQRLLSFSITELSTESEPPVVAAEIWATVSDGRRYTRRQLEADTVNLGVDAAVQSLVSGLPLALSRAWAATSRIGDEDLTTPSILAAARPLES